jgi:hypothetical protein
MVYSEYTSSNLSPGPGVRLLPHGLRLAGHEVLQAGAVAPRAGVAARVARAAAPVTKIVQGWHELRDLAQHFD